MTRGWWFRFSFLAALIVGAFLISTPTFFDLKEDSKFPLKTKINLGLDLQGGLYMVLGIDFNKVYKDEVASYVRKVQTTLKSEGIESSLGSLDTKDARDP